MKRVYIALIILFLINYFLFLKPALKDIEFYKNEIKEMENSYQLERENKVEMHMVRGDLEFIGVVDNLFENSGLQSMKKEYYRSSDNNNHTAEYEVMGNKNDVEIFLEKAYLIEGLKILEFQMENKEDIIIAKIIIMGNSL